MLAVAVGLTSASANGLNAPKGVWIGTAVVAGLLFLLALAMHWRSPVEGRAWVLIDQRIEAAGSLRMDLRDDLTDMRDMDRRYGQWRNETLGVLPEGWRSDFTVPRRDEVEQFEARRMSDSEQARLLVQLELDLHRLRGIRDQMRGYATEALSPPTTPAAPEVVAAGSPPAYVTPDHEKTLRRLLQAALNAVENNAPRGWEDPLDQEMFSLHFHELDTRLEAWDAAAQRRLQAPLTLRNRFMHELSRRGLNDPPYRGGDIARGLGAITEARASWGMLDDDIPPAFGPTDALWRAWASDPSRVAIVEFNPATRGAPSGVVLEEEGDAYPLGNPTHLPTLVEPLRDLLISAQGWDEAHETRTATDAFIALPRNALRQAIRRELVRPRFAIQTGCPGCE